MRRTEKQILLQKLRDAGYRPRDLEFHSKRTARQIRSELLNYETLNIIARESEDAARNRQS